MKQKTIAVAPKGCPDHNLTEEKEYYIKDWYGTTAFAIVDDEGYALFCLTRKCAHLNGKNWILK